MKQKSFKPLSVCCLLTILVVGFAPTAIAQAPLIAEEFPASASTVIGVISHISVIFDIEVNGVVAGDLTVNGAPATDLQLLNPHDDFPEPFEPQGPYLFSGFPVVTAGTVNMVLGAGAIVGATSTVAFGGAAWSVNIEPNPGLVFYESFDLTPGDELYNTPLWEVGDDPVILVGGALDILNGDGLGDGGLSSLSFPDLKDSIGGRIQLGQGTPSNESVNAVFDTPIVGIGESAYVSFLYKPTGALPGTFWYHFWIDEPIGLANNQRGRFRANAGPMAGQTLIRAGFRSDYQVEAATTEHDVGETILLVGKLNMIAGLENDTWEVWINPDPTGGETTPDLVSTSRVGRAEDMIPSRGIGGWRFRVRNNSGEFQFDELRVGATWESVLPQNLPPTPIPPGSSVDAWKTYE